MNLMGMMKQAKEIQAKISKLKEDLGTRTIEASSGGGVVKVTADGHNRILRVEISSDLIKSGDKSMIEDLVLTAVNQAVSQAQELAAKEMEKVTGGMMPPGLL
jgi:hypothetical protein